MQSINEFRFILLVKDIAKQKAFYQEIFDWPIITEWNKGVMFDTGKAIFEIIEKEDLEPVNESVRVALSVIDVWQLYENIKDKVEIIHPIIDHEWGDSSFRIKDPEGFNISLFTTRKPNS